MRTTNSRQAGFTIVELMIVIMVIGVLAAIVLPGIRTNAVRARMSEAILALSPCKNAVAELYNSGGDPPGAGNWGCEITTGASQYVDSIATDDNGVITVGTSTNAGLGAAASKTMTLTPTNSTGGALSFSGITTQVGGFKCQPLTMPAKYLPGSCR